MVVCLLVLSHSLYVDNGHRKKCTISTMVYAVRISYKPLPIYLITANSMSYSFVRTRCIFRMSVRSFNKSKRIKIETYSNCDKESIMVYSMLN